MGIQWNLQSLFVTLIVLFTSMPVHECAHGWVAYKLGDSTAYHQGRLNLNPFHHLDPIGSVMLLVTQRFGWAKPVPINPNNFTRKVTIRGGMAITALAGPVSNLLLALVILLLYKVVALASVAIAGIGFALQTIGSILLLMVSINISLAIFNLLPVPPLDGYKILSYFIPSKWDYKIAQYQQYIFIGMFLLVFLGAFNIPMMYLSHWVMKFFALITFTPELMLY